MKVLALATLLLATLATCAIEASAAQDASSRNETLHELNNAMVNAVYTGVLRNLAKLDDYQRSNLFSQIPNAIRIIIDYLCNSFEDYYQLTTCTANWVRSETGMRRPSLSVGGRPSYGSPLKGGKRRYSPLRRPSFGGNRVRPNRIFPLLRRPTQ